MNFKEIAQVSKSIQEMNEYINYTRKFNEDNIVPILVNNEIKFYEVGISFETDFLRHELEDNMKEYYFEKARTDLVDWTQVKNKFGKYTNLIDYQRYPWYGVDHTCFRFIRYPKLSYIIKCLPESTRLNFLAKEIYEFVYSKSYEGYRLKESAVHRLEDKASSQYFTKKEKDMSFEQRLELLNKIFDTLTIQEVKRFIPNEDEKEYSYLRKISEENAKLLNDDNNKLLKELAINCIEKYNINRNKQHEEEKTMEKNVYLENYANNIINQTNENPYDYRLFVTDYFMEEDQAKLEKILESKMPNLVILHSVTDCDDDIRLQELKIGNIYKNNMYPYFVDFYVAADPIKEITYGLKKEK